MIQDRSSKVQQFWDRIFNVEDIIV